MSCCSVSSALDEVLRVHKLKALNVLPYACDLVKATLIQIQQMLFKGDKRHEQHRKWEHGHVLAPTSVDLHQIKKEHPRT
ncbi:unnamed protein product [Musa acuminata subsp. malaccensis]|uniref:(wild Malaysian banana) hypothetical protein n=1 Tax=Musa acuminata subsp. malaccensis TaxID=214687 RepID=A0A804I9Y4_MUSAM|nr:unnamed protein product [Musa acuminata subsp. malaccensis]